MRQVHSQAHSHNIDIKKVDWLKSTKVRLTLAFSATELQSEEDSRAQHYVRSSNIAGFRKGKAPLQMVRQRFQEDIRRDVVSHLIEEGLKTALDKTHLTPVNRPAVQLAKVDFSKEGALEFSVEFEVQPEIELRRYKGIPLRRYECDVKQEDVDKTLEALRERFAVLVPVENKRPEKSQFVMIELGYEFQTQPMIQETPQEMTLELGSGRLMPELEKALLEMETGESRTLSALFPRDHTDKKLAGREAVFSLRLLEIKRKELPLLDDHLASQVRPGKNLEQLRLEIGDQIKENKEKEGKLSQRESIVDYLLKNNSFDIADSLVEKQAYSLWLRVQEKLKHEGVNNAPQPTEKDIETLKKQAERIVRSSLVLREVAHKEQITIDENLMDTRIQEIAKELKRELTETRKFLSGKGILERIQDEILTDQVFDFLMRNAEVA